MKEKTIKNPYGFIYITTNLVNGKRYIGKRRFINTNGGWQNYLGSGVHLKNSIKKYSKENFVRDIIDIAFSEEELNQKEIQWINNYNAVKSNDFYNIADGGSNGNTFAGKTEEEINEWKRKISEANTGMKLSKEARKKISEKAKLRTGEKNPMYGKKGNYNSNSKPVIQLSKEGTFIAEYPSIADVNRQLGINSADLSNCCNRVKITTLSGFLWCFKSDYENGNISKYKPKTGKLVIQLNLDNSFIKEYSSIKEASNQTNICNQSILSCCKRRYTQAGGYKWKYAKDYYKQQAS
ncbi:NUMOD1 domain-containing DNA-binding protein [Acetivibrio cellulolyticus]|uniref:NUMOD1 domain-containing DNA-binding protein n=1 Tax=Acetivibrio cellulolyticus TaxID=35830 RepID=UPI0001E2C29F|nr:NUMOD1 domain-containing DNA-binding protein [Acetivibrio cellulolyticus]